MKPERLAALAQHGVAFDLETALVQPGLVAPPVVCGSAASAASGKIEGELIDKETVDRLFHHILSEEKLTIIGANIAFDMICMLVRIAPLWNKVIPRVFAMYDPTRGAIRGDVDGRVYDVQIAEQLHAIARGHLRYDPMTGARMSGRYSLREVVKQRLGRDNAKANDKWRLSYALLEQFPIADWPHEARTYPIDDAVNTLEAALAQAGHVPSVGPHDWAGDKCSHCGAQPGASSECRATYRIPNSHEIARQSYVWFAMALGGAHGLKADLAAVDALEAKYHAEHDGKLQPFIDAGIVRADGTENQAVLKGLVVRAYVAGTGKPLSPCSACTGGKVPSPATNGRTKINCDLCDGTGFDLPPEVPRTEKGGISKKRDVLNESGDTLLIAYADYAEDGKIIATYIPWLRNTDREGNAHPGKPITLSPNPLLETGRTSYDGVVQLLPRSGGVRECIVPRPANLFSSQDYKAGELITLGQILIWIVGASRLADALNRGLDPHLAGAATILGISYEEALKRYKAGDKRVIALRQAFKAANFGFGGRMGAARLVQQKRAEDATTVGPDGHVYKGLRFCILMGRADRCGEVKVTEWKGRQYPPLCKKCIECAEDLKVTWLQQWPEMNPYFDRVKGDDESGKPVVQYMSKRLRGFKYNEDGESNKGNAIANGYFQGLLADACKNAMLAAVRECYDHTTIVKSYTPKLSRWEGQPSPLLGSRLLVLAHDEHFMEHPAHIAAEAATRDAEIMVEGLSIACPDMVPAIEAKPCLMTRWYKGAEPVFDTNGRLIPWEPKRE